MCHTLSYISFVIHEKYLEIPEQQLHDPNCVTRPHTCHTWQRKAHTVFYVMPRSVWTYNSYHTQHHPDLKGRKHLHSSLKNQCFPYLEVNHYGIVLCWFQPCCEDWVLWKRSFFLPGQSCSKFWPATFDQRDRLFSWLQNGTWKEISAQNCQKKAFRESGCNMNITTKSVRKDRKEYIVFNFTKLSLEERSLSS